MYMQILEINHDDNACENNISLLLEYGAERKMSI